MLGITPTLQDTATALSFREGSPRTAYSRFDSLNHAVGVAQISNLLYRRFPIGSPANLPARCIIRKSRRLEALRPAPKAFGVHRLEICATPAKRFRRSIRELLRRNLSLTQRAGVRGNWPRKVQTAGVLQLALVVAVALLAQIASGQDALSFLSLSRDQ